MKTSQERSNITKALLQFQKTATGIKKDSQGYNYSYISLDQILELVRPALSDVGVLLNQPIGHIIVGDQVYTTVETVLTHESGEWITSGEMIVKPTNNAKMSDPQNLGSAITYEKRYQLTALLGLSADVDDDAQITYQNAQKWGRKISPAQTQIITKLMNEKGIDKTKMQTITFEVIKSNKTASQLTQDEADRLIAYLGTLPNAQAV